MAGRRVDITTPPGCDPRGAHRLAALLAPDEDVIVVPSGARTRADAVVLAAVDTAPHGLGRPGGSVVRPRRALVPVAGTAGSSARLPLRSDGDAVFRLEADPGHDHRVWFRFDELDGHGPRPTEIAVDGSVVVRCVVGGGVRPPRARVVVPVVDIGSSGTAEIVVRSRAPDGRPAGVGIVAAGTGDGVPGRDRVRSWRRRDAAADAAAADAVVVPSSLVRRWVAHAWGRDAAVVPAPVAVPAGATAVHRGPTIVVPGPVTDGRSGVARRQLELLGVFQVLVERGHAPGWDIVVLGAVAPGGQDAADRLRRRAAAIDGARVVLDPTPAEWAATVGSASLLWSATGIGEDPLTDPARFEPSCPDVAAAMADGVVPIAIEGNATDDLVRTGRNGETVPSFALLLAATEALAGDAARLARYSAEARRVADELAAEAVAARARALLDRLRPSQHRPADGARPVS